MFSIEVTPFLAVSFVIVFVGLLVWGFHNAYLLRLKSGLLEEERKERKRLEKEVQTLKDKVESLNIDRETGAFRKDVFLEKGHAVLHRASRENAYKYACMGFDVDGLKRVNDRYGHSVGDELIKLVATAISHNIRPADIFGRMGGDEFAVLLVGDLTIKRIEIIKEKIRAQIAMDHRFDGLDIGVSIGYFIGDSRETPIGEAHKIADAGVLLDKKDRHIVRGFSEGNGTDEKKN